MPLIRLAEIASELDAKHLYAEADKLDAALNVFMKLSHDFNMQTQNDPIQNRMWPLDQQEMDDYDDERNDHPRYLGKDFHELAGDSNVPDESRKDQMAPMSMNNAPTSGISNVVHDSMSAGMHHGDVNDFTEENIKKNRPDYAKYLNNY